MRNFILISLLIGEKDFYPATFVEIVIGLILLVLVGYGGDGGKITSIMFGEIYVREKLIFLGNVTTGIGV